MKIVVDSNILFSALIKDSKTREILLESNNEFFFPSYVFYEALKHEEELLQKSCMDKKEFLVLLNLILERIKIVSEAELEKHKSEAVSLTKDIDINDVLFAASCLAVKGSVLWSDDKKLKQITKFKVLNTSEIISNL